MIRAEGEAQQSMYRINQRFAELQAEDAIRRGKKEEQAHRKQTGALIGAQRAALAAQGIEVDSGSALAIQEDTAALSEDDARTIRMNAYREAYGYKSQALSTGVEANFARIGTNARANNSIISGGMSAINTGVQGYMNWKKK